MWISVFFPCGSSMSTVSLTSDLALRGQCGPQNMHVMILSLPLFGPTSLPEYLDHLLDVNGSKPSF